MNRIFKVAFTVLGFVLFAAGSWLTSFGSDDMQLKPRQVTLTDVAVTFESVKDNTPLSIVGSFVDTETGRAFKATINDAAYVHFKVASNQPLAMVKEVSIDTVYGVEQGKYSYALGILFKLLGAIVIVSSFQIWFDGLKAWWKQRKQTSAENSA